MKNKIYIAIICAFSIVFAVSSGFLIKHYCDSAKQAEMYDNLIEVVETEPEETTELMNYSEEKTFIPEYQELYLQNNDMVGWIKVEDTKINYPVMQSKDNPNFYLKHGFDKAYTDYGCPYVQLQEFRFYKLIRIILPCNPDCCTLYAYNLTDNLKELLIQSLVLPVIVLHVMLIFDVILNQFYVCIDIIHQIKRARR